MRRVIEAHTMHTQSRDCVFANGDGRRIRLGENRSLLGIVSNHSLVIFNICCQDLKRNEGHGTSGESRARASAQGLLLPM
jgi:hypothetical protein